MTAALALRSARAIGVRVSIDGEDLVLEAPKQPPEAILKLLSHHKAEIVKLLPLADDDWSAEDWQVFFEERAAIAEFDGGLPRPEAEKQAFACCVTEWLNRNPAPSEASRCVACSRGDRLSDPLVPFGNEATGHAWLHRACWPAWCRERKVEAVASLASMGIET